MEFTCDMDEPNGVEIRCKKKKKKKKSRLILGDQEYPQRYNEFEVVENCINYGY